MRAALALFALCGCVATYEGTPLDLPAGSSGPSFGNSRAALVVAVHEPEIHMDKRGNSVSESSIDAARAIGLANALQKSGRFARADLEHQLPCEPDVVLVAIPNPQPGYSDHDNALLLLGLGVIPVIDTWDRGQYFVRKDAPDQKYLFIWQRVDVLWLLSGPLALLPGWHLGKAEDTFSASFARFLDLHWSALSAGVTPKGDPKCLAP